MKWILKITLNINVRLFNCPGIDTRVWTYVYIWKGALGGAGLSHFDRFPFGLRAPDSSQITNCVTLIKTAEAKTPGISITEKCNLSQYVSRFHGLWQQVIFPQFLKLGQNASYVYAKWRQAKQKNMCCPCGVIARGGRREAWWQRWRTWVTEMYSGCFSLCKYCIFHFNVLFFLTYGWHRVSKGSWTTWWFNNIESLTLGNLNVYTITGMVHSFSLHWGGARIEVELTPLFHKL